MTKKDQARQELREQLNALTMEALDFDACECINPSDLDDGIDHVIETLEEHIDESSDIIYCSRAMEFLSENDPSLRRSLELAGEFGYKPEDLDSEKLATILNIEEKRNALRRIKDEIEEIIDERNEIEENEEDQEGISLADAGQIIADAIVKMHEKL